MKRLIEDYKKIPKEIYILSLATMINRTGEFVIPFLTFYLTQKLGISLAVTGLIVAVSGFVKVPGGYFGGKLNDKYNSKVVYMAFQAVSILLLIPCAFISNPFITVPLLVLFSLTTSMVRTPTLAMISDLLPQDQRKLGYVVRYIGINIGVAIAGTAGGLLFKNHLIFLFLGDALTLLFSILLVGFGIKRSNLKKIREKTIGENEKAEKGNILNVLIRRKPLLLYMLFSSMFFILFDQVKFAIPLTTEFRFGDNGAVIFGILMTINAVTATILALIQHSFSKRISYLGQIIIGGLFFAVGFGLYGYVNTINTFILATIVWSIGEVFIFTNAAVVVMNNAPENFRGRLSSVYNIFFVTIGTLGIMLEERLVDAVGLLNSWNYLAVIGLIACIALFILKNRFFKNNH